MRLPCLGTGFLKRIYAFAAVKGLKNIKNITI
jgi:hypothetical protein